MGILDSLFGKKEEKEKKLVCPRCKYTLTESQIFADCPQCGLHLPDAFRKHCPRCNEPNPIDVGVCLKCGLEFGKKEEQRKEVYSCPICGYRMEALFVECPVCGTRFM